MLALYYNFLIVKFYCDYHSLIPEGPVISSFYPAPTPITFWIPLFISGSYKLFFFKVLITKGLRNFQTLGLQIPSLSQKLLKTAKNYSLLGIIPTAICPIRK